jgi:hypothetical protein
VTIRLDLTANDAHILRAYLTQENHEGSWQRRMIALLDGAERIKPTLPLRSSTSAARRTRPHECPAPNHDECTCKEAHWR